jgi:hypothetical protein
VVLALALRAKAPHRYQQIGQFDLTEAEGVAA